MEEQPVPRNDQWPWSMALWSLRLRRARSPGVVRILHGVREHCTQCGEMIFADKIACVVILQHGQKWMTLHFHRTCYITWARTDYRRPPAQTENVLAFPALRPTARCDETQVRQEDGKPTP